jgi:hypothetical protein
MLPDKKKRLDTSARRKNKYARGLISIGVQRSRLVSLSRMQQV